MNTCPCPWSWEGPCWPRARSQRRAKHKREAKAYLQRALEVSGDGWVSTTTLEERTWLRAGIVNYLSTARDADRVLGVLRRAADRA